MHGEQPYIMIIITQKKTLLYSAKRYRVKLIEG